MFPPGLLKKKKTENGFQKHTYYPWNHITEFWKKLFPTEMSTANAEIFMKPIMINIKTLLQTITD